MTTTNQPDSKPPTDVKPASAASQEPAKVAPVKQPEPIKLTFAVDRISVMRFRQGTDRVTIWTDLPDPAYGGKRDDQKLTIEFRATRGAGADFCRKYFPGVPLEEKEYE